MTLGSRQVDWFAVHEFVAPRLEVACWPMAGTPLWAALDDDDPAKIAAVLDFGRRMALQLDTVQTALAQASHDISTAEDWRQLALDVRNHETIRIPRRAS